MTGRVVALVSIGVITLAILGILAAVLLKGGVDQSSPSVAGLLGFLALLINALISTVLIRDVKSKVDGHLAQHQSMTPGHTDEQLRAIVQEAVQELLPSARDPEPPSQGKAP